MGVSLEGSAVAPPSEFQSLIEQLCRDGGWSYFWTSKDKRSQWFEAGDGAGQMPDPTEFDIYFGVHPTAEPASEFERSKIATVSVVNCLFSEFDFSDFGSEDACREHVADLVPEPSAKVASGGGYHTYWFFHEPWRLDTDGDREAAKVLQAAWVVFTGGDGGAKDLARVLRVPGTFNHKYEEPRLVEIVSWHPERRYSPKELQDISSGTTNGRSGASPSSDGRPASTMGAKSRQPIPDGVKLTGDDRGAYLLSVAGYLWRRWNLSPETLSAMMQSMNEIQCDPPVNEERLERIVKQTTKYDHNDATFNMTLALWKAIFEFLGYEFRRNLAGQVLEVNGEPVDDYERAEVLMRTMLAKPAGVAKIERAYMTVAKEDSYHEVAERLESLEWDGQDHIGKLMLYFDSEPAGWFEVALTRWLIGCCAKADHQATNGDGVQSFMLALDGPQGIGKSHFVWQLAKPFSAKYFIEGPLTTSDKDAFVRLLGYFVWEVSELGATIRKQDIEALKSIISQPRVTVRRAYGRYDMQGPVLCSLLGTVNNSAGLLADPTGNRRFAIVKIDRIDWTYSEKIDMEQVWAQAMSLYRNGTSWNFDRGEVDWRDEVNTDYEFVDPIEAALLECFDITDNPAHFIPSSRIAERLKDQNVRMGTDRSLYMAIANTMTRLGAGTPKRNRSEPYRGKRGYYGVFEKP